VFEACGVPWDLATQDVTHVALTHGHDDHKGDAATICTRQGATLFAVYELAMHLAQQGVTHLELMNTGGTVHARDFDLTFVKAFHSSSSDGVYLGNPCGIVLAAKEGKTVYHMGDTEIFSDMELVQELYAPHIGIVPIGDRFTMGARTAALACNKYFSFDEIIPCHYGTFPIIDQTADAFVRAMKGRNVLVPKPGVPFTI
jgi:L-ascorbate metabolism protein UlaG (beta-lactamase superfamily)